MYSFIVSLWFIVLTMQVLWSENPVIFYEEVCQEEGVSVYTTRSCIDYNKSADKVYKEISGYYASWRDNNRLVNDLFMRRLST